MMKNYGSNTRRTFIVIAICVLLIGASLPLTARALAPNPFLPPPPPPPPSTPTPTPTPAPTIVPPSPVQSTHGALIALRVQVADEAVWQTYFWQDLWTVVQWQDQWGKWHDVMGWQGTLDEIEDGVGTKMWWVTDDDLSKGPFRWVIYQHQGGPLLVNSASFDLPDAPGKKIAVEVTLEP